MQRFEDSHRRTHNRSWVPGGYCAKSRIPVLLFVCYIPAIINRTADHSVLPLVVLLLMCAVAAFGADAPLLCTGSAPLNCGIAPRCGALASLSACFGSSVYDICRAICIVVIKRS